MRSYGQFCAVARSLDVIGDRWTLLIVRELAERGPCRYTDLRDGLPGIATNLLADRLRGLEAAGVVARDEAPPPVAATLLRLTDRGEDLRPLLAELTRWGMPLMVEERSGDAFRGHWLAAALEQMLSDGEPGAPETVIQLEADAQPILVRAGGGEVSARAGRAEQPALTLSGPPRVLAGVLFGLVPLEGAAALGISAAGDAAVLARFRGPTAATFGLA